MRPPILAFCLLLFGSLSPSPSVAAEDGLSVMRKVDAALSGPAEKLQVRMEIQRVSGTTDVRTLTMWTKAEPGKARRSLIRFDSPSNLAGTALLSILRGPGKEDHHLYVPGLAQTRRIAPTDKSEAFVQSDFTIEDLTVAMDPEKREYALKGEAPCGEGRTCWLVDDTPHTEKAARESGYGHVVLYVDQEHGAVHRVDFYDKQGGLLKVMQSQGLAVIDGRARFSSVTMANAKTGSRTTMAVVRREGGAAVDDSVFSPASLGSL